MIDSRTVIPTTYLLLTGALALAQTPMPAPAPVAPPAPPARVFVQPSPRAIDPEAAQQLRDLAEQAREQAREAVAAAPAVQIDAEQIRAMAEDARAQAEAAVAAAPFPPSAALGDFAFNFKTPMAFAQNLTLPSGVRRGMSDDRLYEAGSRALDAHRWDEALEDFNQVAARAGTRADGGWYWKAYTLNKLGRRDEALAAIAELRKSYASSRWIDEAKALEVQIRQDQGKPVSPEAESDEDLKLMALNGLMQSDPDRALPLVENILKGSGSPRLKARALFVLAQSNTPRGMQIVEQIARGQGGNPDLQVKAIEYLGQRRRQNNNNQNQLLMEIYNSSSDTRVKSAILQQFRNTRDTERLLQIARAEKNPDLREQTYAPLGDIAGQPELWQIYQNETTADGKIAILRVMQRNGNADKLVEVIKNEKDPKVRRTAISVLATQENNAPERLVSIYSSETDPQLREAIISALSNQRNAKYLIDLARAEKDPKLKLRIVDRLSNMHSKEANDYLMELLK